MRNIRKQLPYTVFVIILALTIVGYNYWSYKCGYCTLSSLTSLSIPAVILIGFNLLAGLLLVVVRLRKKKQAERNHCDCGETLRRIWQFCPSCGHGRKALP